MERSITSKRWAYAVSRADVRGLYGVPGSVAAARRVTIADVAADAGVGVGTVSRVLNRSVQVRADTLQAVQESIDRLGYRPSHAAAALVRGTARTVAVVVAHLTRPSAVVRVASALAVLAEQGPA
jgi:DNA-binding LacI/PurR family transcriptional regulator